MRVDAREDVDEVVERVGAVLLARRYERVEHGEVLARTLTANEEEVLPSECKSKLILPMSHFARRCTIPGTPRTAARSRPWLRECMVRVRQTADDAGLQAHTPCCGCGSVQRQFMGIHGKVICSDRARAIEYNRTGLCCDLCEKPSGQYGVVSTTAVCTACRDLITRIIDGTT